ncbi:heme utilization cystosolic carrier protein HutX [Halarcobacter ebronensis]|uniref:Heme utilization cystosolic carrier protein HutX n=1 Tax=Halarcobacter ebronensis TaxID=1462615 RepID=A0A4Q1AMD5_9BACT|nr:heme utilization cystosolic carrier protein HutX [Halarcobacter ebronensis]QKF82826.1 putative heme iron utilization protein, ChuX/HutX family [Halarcobacter ebronensis]RXK06847.1 heme utilization cystosolic carrier protein HutX [Halarcobacter ebronensis]
MIKEKIKKILELNPDITTLEIAQELNVNEYEVLQNIDESFAKAIDGKYFDEVIEDISKWGKILMIKITPSFVIEIKDIMPTGTYGHGYYNFDSKESSISGHLKVDDIEKIIFVSKNHRGMLSHSVVFYDSKGEHIFKVFVARDENRELLSSQVEMFMQLKNRF